MTTDCGSIQLHKYILVGVSPLTTSQFFLEPFESSPYVCPGQTHGLMVGPYVPGYQYEVQVTNGTYTVAGANQFWIHFNNYTPSPPFYDASVSVRVHNGCFWSSWKSVNLYTEPSCAGGGCELCFLTYPNPTDGELTVAWNPEAEPHDTLQAEPFDLVLYDSQGTEVFSQSKQKGTIRINTRHLPNGFYYLHIRYREGLIRRQIRVER